MARFLVRIELHHAPKEKYETLHKAMANIGFTHRPPPTGEYQNANAEDISVEAMKAKLSPIVDNVHVPSSALVAKGETAWW